MGRLSDTNIADLEKGEIVDLINTYAGKMCFESPFSIRKNGVQSNPFEWKVLFDPIAVFPNSFIEYVFIKRKMTSDDTQQPNHIAFFIAYDSNNASEDIDRVEIAMNLLLKNYHAYTLYFNSELFRYDVSLHFIPNALWKMISDVLSENPCNKLIYERLYVRVHRNVIS